MWRGVLLSQVQMLCGELEISVDTPTLSGHVIIVFRCAPGPVAF
jgi:hypothetical protein